MPGTAAICSTGASRTRLIDPNTFISSRLRFGPDAGQVVEGGPDASLGAQVAVVGDGEAMRLVAESLDEVEGRRGRRQEDRFGRAWQEQLLAFLGEPGQRQVVEAELVEDRLGGAHLALAAVDDDEVGHRPAARLLDPLLARSAWRGTGGAGPPGGWRSRSGR